MLFGDGTGSFGPETDVALSEPNAAIEPQSAAISDFNGDGRLDVATVNNYTGTVFILLGDGGAGGFSTTSVPTAGNRAIEAADLNGDTRPDIITLNDDAQQRISTAQHWRSGGDIPRAPTMLRNATAGNQTANSVVATPGMDGGAPVIGYVVTAYVGYTPVKDRIFNSTPTTQTVTGLTNGTTYRFRVLAYNTIGISGYSKASNPVTPAPTAPNPPTTGSATASNAQATCLGPRRHRTAARRSSATSSPHTSGTHR